MAQALVTSGPGLAEDEVPIAEQLRRRSPAWRLIKRAFALVAKVLVSPMVATDHVLARLSRPRAVDLFQTYGCVLAMLPGWTGILLRRAFYQGTMLRCSDDCVIAIGTYFATPEVEIGRGVHIGAYCNIGHVTFGDDVMLGSNVTVLSGRNQHYYERLDVPIRFQGGVFTRVTIGNDVWVGSGAIVTDDVGAQAVISMGAVVAKPVPQRKIVVGNPARIVGERGTGSLFIP